MWTNPAQVVFCNRPISGLADLRGLKIRVASAMHGDFAAGLGATQIAAPRFGRLITWTLGAAGLNDFLQAGFAALANKSNELEQRAGQ